VDTEVGKTYKEVMQHPALKFAQFNNV